MRICSAPLEGIFSPCNPGRIAATQVPLSPDGLCTRQGCALRSTHPKPSSGGTAIHSKVTALSRRRISRHVERRDRVARRDDHVRHH
jgi:hypothetical protein